MERRTLTLCRPGPDSRPRLVFPGPVGHNGHGGRAYIMADRYRGGMDVGFTSDRRLAWAEHADDMPACIAHGKRLKRWRREWKCGLIEPGNPEWRDLFPTTG